MGCEKFLQVVVCTALVLISSVLYAQIPGTNANVVSGIGDQYVGDRFLQRQNEPAIAVSTRNPDHWVSAFNDYSTVDFAGDPNIEPAAEAWMGVAFSYDRGRSWSHALVPGYLQDTSPAGVASPLHGLPAASDPVLASGPRGRFYLGGLFFDRSGTSKIGVLRYVDKNNSESRHSINYEGTTVVDIGSASPTGAFTDKPSIAADVIRNGATCAPVYITYSVFDGQDANGNFRSKIMLARSLDCGVTFEKPIKLNGTYGRNQGTQLLISPVDGTVWVTWRTFGPDRVLIVKSTNFGATFTTPTVVNTSPMQTYEQDTLPDQPGAHPTFRSEAFSAMAVDGSGILYAVWQERVSSSNGPNGGLPASGGVPRIVITRSTNQGTTWTQRRAVEMGSAGAHQVMPSLTFAAGVLRLLFYDFRNDLNNVSLDTTTGKLSGRDRIVDVRYAESDLTLDNNGNPKFNPSVQVTQYAAGQKDQPNLPMYQGGTVPFFGDYIGLNSLPMVPTENGNWRFTTQATDYAARNAAAAWTDNRDVIIPAGFNFTQYSPPGTGTTSCTNPGSRNANIYAAEVSPGLIAGSPSNAKSLVSGNGPLKRSFVVYLQNTTAVTKFYRLTLTAASGTIASFTQSGAPPATIMDREILPLSGVTQTVFVDSSTATSPANVSVQEITGLGATGVKTDGLNSNVALNNDPTTPVDSTNSETHNPQVTNPQVTNPQVTNTAITDVSWAITNTGNTTSAYTSLLDVENVQQLKNNGYTFKVSLKKLYLVPTLSGCNTVELEQPVPLSTVANPQVTNPQVTNPQVTNPQVTNPQVTNPQVTNTTYYIAPSDSATAASTFAVSAASSPVAQDGTAFPPRVPDAVVLTLRVTQTKKGGPAFDATKNKVTHIVWAQAANTGDAEPQFVVKSTK
jgi:hypothetical protein